MGDGDSVSGRIACTFQGLRNWGRVRIYPRLGFTLRFDGKIFVEEGVH